MTTIPHKQDEAAELAGSAEAGLDWLAQRCQRLAVVTLGEKVRGRASGAVAGCGIGQRQAGWGVLSGCLVSCCKPSYLPLPSHPAGLHDQGAWRAGAHRHARLLGRQGAAPRCMPAPLRRLYGCYTWCRLAAPPAAHCPATR